MNLTNMVKVSCPFTWDDDSMRDPGNEIFQTHVSCLTQNVKVFLFPDSVRFGRDSPRVWVGQFSQVSSESHTKEMGFSSDLTEFFIFSNSMVACHLSLIWERCRNTHLCLPSAAKAKVMQLGNILFISRTNLQLSPTRDSHSKLEWITKKFFRAEFQFALR